jgi:hypothetical protein
MGERNELRSALGLRQASRKKTRGAKHKKVPRPPQAEKPWKGKISVGGPRQRQERVDIPGGAGWNWGDIEFREDGAIFIRNPYLADAIEAHLKRNHEAIQRKDPNVKHLVRIVRDEGWSGWETNVVC